MRKKRTTEKGVRMLLTGRAGFTLVELLMALLISSFVGAAIFLAYRTQSRTQNAQEQLVELQENVRAAMVTITSEVRMAGFDPTGEAGAGIVKAQPGLLQFTLNRKYKTASGADDTKLDEDLTYCIAAKYDPNRVGVVTAYPPNAPPPALARESGAGGGPQPVANNIEALEFMYRIGDRWYVDPAHAGQNLARIKAVTVSLLMRAPFPDQDFNGDMDTLLPASKLSTFKVHDKNNEWTKYVNKIKADKSQGHYRRRVAIATIQLRNMNL